MGKSRLVCEDEWSCHLPTQLTELCKLKPSPAQSQTQCKGHSTFSLFHQKQSRDSNQNMTWPSCCCRFAKALPASFNAYPASLWNDWLHLPCAPDSLVHCSCKSSHMGMCSSAPYVVTFFITWLMVPIPPVPLNSGPLCLTSYSTSQLGCLTDISSLAAIMYCCCY
jgi:hypothetical protein